MRFHLLLPIAYLLFTSACAQPSGSAHTNALIDETSPYLLQHAYNPVDWHPWGDQALEKAEEEKKLIIVSIGYAACHWCHVMEHESFEDSTVADFMNEHFISIKVDREERPDVDQIYMNASQLLTGRGGWPLNAVALPDGRPFFAGTYLPKDQWMQVLRKLVETYQDDPERLQTIASEVTEGIQTIDQLEVASSPTTYSQETLNQLFQTWKPQIDFDWGGNQGAPKFPMPVNLNFLMQYHYFSGDTSAKEAVLTTLDKMALGGIYDHLGGGFARYATDAKWKVPHFEKMLYDNAQLVSLYSNAYQLTGDSLYSEVIYETLEFIEREMTSPEGAFYSSLDADSEGEEGKFYVWTAEEIEATLGSNAGNFTSYFSISQKGNWEAGKNILYANQRIADFAQSIGTSSEKVKKSLQQAKSRLLEQRSERIRPGLDDKILTAWNALMLNGYVDAYRALGDPRFLQSALTNANFLKSQIIQSDFSLTRSYKDGVTSIPGFLDDYAHLIAAYINLYQATFEESWLYTAKSLTDYVLENFQDAKTPMLFYTSSRHASLIARQKEIDDNVIPSSNSVMAKNLWTLGLLLAEDAYTTRAQSMVNTVYSSVEEYPNFHANWASLLGNIVHEPYEVAILGESSQITRQGMDKQYLPNVLFLGGQSEGSLTLLENKLVTGQTTIYVCQNKVCKLPVTQVGAALAQIR
ncbi:thioredoxin domain-containing protein [Tunicatimonas pelagia]|uniref:thioredoxin domain-containing protein n=1 Tax=Tunicatimonas pelagia TaxID=931531 RepID=UPI002665DD8A|nr:thioredoxin domain-containing protein [Tunicatimonas pelagia]WKN42636.1 thioredoxin domain-containing protein [Tunicatimonas pelagia]